MRRGREEEDEDYLLAVLVRDDGTAGCACVGGNHDAAVEETADDCGTRAGGLGQRNALCMESRIAVVVREVEAAHRVCLWVWWRGCWWRYDGLGDRPGLVR